MTAARPGPVPPGVVRRFTRSREKPRGVVYQVHPDSATFVALPDPVYHFGVASRTGTQMVKKLQLDPLGPEPPVLFDHFTWRPFHGKPASDPQAELRTTAE